jgi:putative lipoprotein
MQRCFAVSVAAALSVACSLSPQSPGSAGEPDRSAAPEPTRSQETTVRAYDCGNELYVVAEFRPATDDVWLFLPGKSGSLPHVPSASGAKYDDGETTFWAKGDKASVDTGNGVQPCVENRRRSTVESAKLRGNDYWATGNEPGWSLELGPERIVFTTDYGESRYESTTPEPVSDRSSRTTTWSAIVEGHDLVVTIRAERCADTMSDETFENRVEVRLDERIFSGCGQALH